MGGLSYKLGPPRILGKDTEHNMALFGGLGCFGVGQQWNWAEEYDREHPSWATAPEMPCPEEQWKHRAEYYSRPEVIAVRAERKRLGLFPFKPIVKE